MNEGYPPYTPKTDIKVTNPYITKSWVSAKAIRPWSLRENYITIPDLSWVVVSPGILEIPAKSSGVFEISIKIPDNEKPLHYNQSWEAWIWIIPNFPSDVNGGLIGVDTQTQYMVRILIKTPPREISMQTPKDYYNFLIIFMVFIVIPAVLFIVKNIVSKKNRSNKKPTIFYFKKNNA